MPSRMATCALVCSTALLPACSSFRNFYSGLKNDNLEGKTATPLTSTAWITPDGTQTGVAPEAEWRLLAFFLPK